MLKTAQKTVLSWFWAGTRFPGGEIAISRGQIENCCITFFRPFILGGMMARAAEKIGQSQALECHFLVANFDF